MWGGLRSQGVLGGPQWGQAGYGAGGAIGGSGALWWGAVVRSGWLWGWGGYGGIWGSLEGPVVGQSGYGVGGYRRIWGALGGTWGGQAGLEWGGYEGTWSAVG